MCRSVSCLLGCQRSACIEHLPNVVHNLPPIRAVYEKASMAGCRVHEDLHAGCKGSALGSIWLDVPRTRNSLARLVGPFCTHGREA